MQNLICEVMHGECLEKMKLIADGSMDAIICDPPYGTVKGAGLDGWDKSKTEWDTAINPAEIFKECERVLRENGKLILFSQEPYTSKLITEAHGNLPFNYRLIWLKDHFANALVAKKAPVSYFEDIIVFTKKYDTLDLNPLRNYARNLFKFIGKTKKDIFKDMGNQSICHFMRTESMQFGICTESCYNQLIEIYLINEWDGFKPFSELKRLNLKAESTFNLPLGEKKKSNVLSYKKDYQGLHPTQKPVELMKDLVRTYTNEGDKVLDFTCGSGSTGVACKQLRRNFIGIELDPAYCEVARKRLKDHQQYLEFV